MKSLKLQIFKVTPRLIIRPLVLEDHENWRQTYSSLRPALNEWDENPWDDKELTLQKFKQLLKIQRERRLKDSYYEFGVFRKDDGVLVGSVSLMDVSRGIFQNAYLGYRVFNPFWSQGYAQEACKAAKTIAFKDLKLHRLEAAISPENKKSIQVAKALGFHKEGLSRKRLLVNRKWRDMLIYALTK